MKIRCTKCSLLLPAESFYNDKKKDNGKNSWCKTCFSKNVNDRYKTPKGRYTTLKKDAKARGISFSITFEEYNGIRKDNCDYCGAKVTNAAGIDRLDNSKGYEIGNVIACCKWCNYAKGTWSARAFYEKCSLVVKNFPKQYREKGVKYTDDLKR